MNLKLWLTVLVFSLVILPASGLLYVRLEGEKPSATLDLASLSIRDAQTLSVSVSDTKSGLRKLWIGLLKDGREIVLLDKPFPAKSFIGGGKIHDAAFKIHIEPKKMGITDGKAILRMVVRDYSWRRWWHGNKTYLEKEVVIDTVPPSVDVLTRIHNVSPGGSGLVIYKTSEPCPKSGVHIGDNFYPGHSGYFDDNDIFLAFFALDYNQGPGVEIYVMATDGAGNSTRAGFPHYIKRKFFKKDIIRISDKFLSSKMPEFDVKIPTDSQTPLLDKFLVVNRELRKKNYETITKTIEKTANTLYWEGAFLRLPGSERKAGFADRRDYHYMGRKVDRQVHLGIDLAAVPYAPVPAANSGKVVFVGHIGIYGKTVVIDHGFGLLSMYSHLSSFDVDKEQPVSKGDIIGRTGSTGLAGGDHLHFGMLVHKTFVNPIEWWDATWIKNNISSKIDAKKSRFASTRN
ncbi:MAG: M23 family metallopeptidase [Deltaproteobacteria bacterium]|nr:M23 family metallopeptidase [Deltaproteobacteria bacterium]